MGKTHVEADVLGFHFPIEEPKAVEVEIGAILVEEDPAASSLDIVESERDFMAGHIARVIRPPYTNYSFFCGENGQMTCAAFTSSGS